MVLRCALVLLMCATVGAERLDTEVFREGEAWIHGPEALGHKDLELAAAHVQGAADLAAAVEEKSKKVALTAQENLAQLAKAQEAAMKKSEAAKQEAVDASMAATKAEKRKEEIDEEYIEAAKSSKAAAAAEVVAHAAGAADAIGEHHIEQEWGAVEAEKDRAKVERDTRKQQAEADELPATKAQKAYEAAAADAATKLEKAQEAVKEEARLASLLQKAEEEVTPRRQAARLARKEEIHAMEVEAEKAYASKIAQQELAAAQKSKLDADKAEYVAFKHFAKEQVAAKEAADFDSAGQQVHTERSVVDHQNMVT